MNEAGITVQAVHSSKNPEAIDVALYCPWCGVLSRITVGKFFHQALVRHGIVERYCFVVCQARECNRAVFIVVEDLNGTFFRVPEPYPGKVYPVAHAQYAPEGVPAQIAEEFRETLEWAWSGHYLGAALVGRRVLQAAARDVLGGKRKDLHTELADIPDDRLNKALKDQAEHVRLIGNDAAHVDPVDGEDVNHLLDFVEQVLDAPYVGPARSRNSMRSAQRLRPRSPRRGLLRPRLRPHPLPRSPQRSAAGRGRLRRALAAAAQPAVGGFAVAAELGAAGVFAVTAAASADAFDWTVEASVVSWPAIELPAARSSDPPIEQGAHYLTVWQRDAAADGHWRILRNLVLPAPGR